MISLRYLRSQNFFNCLWRIAVSTLCLFLLFSCAAPLPDPTLDDPVDGIASQSHAKKRFTKSMSSRYEWAIQNYEAGAYDEAIEQFQSLQSAGTDVPEYEMISFYLGMSFYRKDDFQKARAPLEAFLAQNLKKQEALEARITLLLLYERMSLWDNVVTLAAETDKLQLFQNNRALLKLLWAHALREKGELLGAKTALQDAAEYLSNVPSSNDFYTRDPNRDLWGRYYSVQVLVQQEACSRLEPNEIANGKKKRRLYGPWLEAEVDCWQKTLADARDVFKSDGLWLNPAVDALGKGIEGFVSKIHGHLASEAKSLEQVRTLKKIALQQLYRLLASIDQQLKNFKNQRVNVEPLEKIRKRLDLLIVRLSSPS